MFSHNKFLLFLIGCIIANPCFADGNVVGVRGINGSSFNNYSWQNWQIKPINSSLHNFCSCPKNYYVSRCGDMDLDLWSIISRVKVKSVKSDCWNDSYTDMHYLLHMKDNTSDTYSDTTHNSFYNSSALWKKNYVYCGDNVNDPNKEVYILQKIREDVYSACMAEDSSCTCLKCPNNGQTDSETELAKDAEGTLVTPKHWASFNTIADCYTNVGTDERGTFKVNNYDEIPIAQQNESHRCYYSYYSE